MAVQSNDVGRHIAHNGRHTKLSTLWILGGDHEAPTTRASSHSSLKRCYNGADRREMRWCSSVWFDSRSSLIIIIRTFIYSLAFLSVFVCPSGLVLRSVALYGEAVARKMAVAVYLLVSIYVSL